MENESLFLAVEDAYDRWASSYDSDDNPMVFAVTHGMEEVAATVRDKVVVEFGCGTGRNLVRLKRAGARHLIGCDLSQGMLDRARIQAQKWGPDSALTLFQQDMAQPLPLAARTADLVLFSLTLEHVSDLSGPLREARRLLRPGGECVIFEIHPFLSLNAVSAHFQDGGTVVRMPTYPHRFSDYVNAFVDSRLVPVRCREWTPQDFDGEVPEKIFKRGATTPLLVQFVLQKAP